MNNKIIALVLIFAFIFMDCNGDDKTSPVIQKNSQEEKSVTSVSSQPNEATFNRQHVLQNYQNTPLKILDISERNKDGRNSIAITLSVPLDPSINHQKYFNISSAN